MVDATSMHVVIITRWRERYAEYERYIDHRRHRVTYIATELGLGSVPRTVVDTWVVPATDDLASVRQGMSALAARHGPPDCIVALKEDDLLIGAQLREEWNCPGPRCADLLPFRNKHRMAMMIAGAGLPIEPFALVRDVQSVLDFCGAHGWPVVLKPLCSSASEGVVRANHPDDLAGVSFSVTPLLVQAYNPRPVHHVDGVFDGRQLTCWRVARYINTCLDFRRGSFLGSVEEDDPELIRMTGSSAERFLRVLTGSPTVVHLEMFVDPMGRCTFLEVGARVGGGETALLWREVHGYDLAEQAFRMQCGFDAQLYDAEGALHRGAGDDVCGHLLIPAPLPRPCRITQVTPMVGPPIGPYAESLPLPGQLLPAADSYYEHVGGRFRFRGRSTRDVEHAIRVTAARFRVSAEPATRAELAVGASSAR